MPSPIVGGAVSQDQPELCAAGAAPAVEHRRALLGAAAEALELAPVHLGRRQRRPTERAGEASERRRQPPAIAD